jgi:hypothetical protein
MGGTYSTDVQNFSQYLFLYLDIDDKYNIKCDLMKIGW